MISREYDYNENQITSLAIEGDYLWMAFQYKDGECPLYRVRVDNPETILYDMGIDANKINKVKSKILGNNHIFLALDDNTHIGMYLKASNPLTIRDYMYKPDGVTQEAIDVAIDDSLNSYFLLPGVDSGTYTKVLKYNSYNYLVFEKELSESDKTVRNASTIGFSNGALFILTNEDPARMIRMNLNGNYNIIQGG